MARRLSGRTALITGASRGIGRGIAERFANEGANLAIHCGSNEDAALEVAAIAKKQGVQARVYRADIGDQVQCNKLADEVLRDFEQLDILINNAGVGSTSIQRPAISDATDIQWHQLMSVNFWGPVWLCRALVPHMRRAVRSDVIMMSSIATRSLSPSFGVYSVSKTALEAMAHTLAREEKPHGMRVNIIAPGLVDTDMGESVVAATGRGSSLRDADANSPFGFVCTPADIAATALHLCSEDGRYITNQRIQVSGG
jgi:NAD(P)-dependent dehydrogenase (short-subunit alcohol dehydrogenase family)